MDSAIHECCTGHLDDNDGFATLRKFDNVLFPCSHGKKNILARTSEVKTSISVK